MGLALVGLEAFLANGLAATPRSPPKDRVLLLPLTSTRADHVATVPPFTLEELRDFNEVAQRCAPELHAGMDGTPVTNLFAHDLEVLWTPFWMSSPQERPGGRIQGIFPYRT